MHARAALWLAALFRVVGPLVPHPMISPTKAGYSSSQQNPATMKSEQISLKWYTYIYIHSFKCIWYQPTATRKKQGRKYLEAHQNHTTHYHYLIHNDLSSNRQQLSQSLNQWWHSWQLNPCIDWPSRVKGYGDIVAIRRDNCHWYVSHQCQKLVPNLNRYVCLNP